jgi:uncharacterized protein
MRDYEQARFWFNRAAHRGDPTAQFFLGRIFSEGLGTEQNIVIGHMWYELSYRFGYELAIRSMNRLQSEMSEETLMQSQLMALRWMNAYAERNPGSVRIVRRAEIPGTPDN